MKSNYKLLGDYIQEVNKRDTNLKVKLLLGVSIQKKFIPSIANIIGTDMSTYKIIKKNQFAYGPVTSRNGDKISIALLQDYDEAIISQAYYPFEIIDTNNLLPEYLMMWFRRPEFDRYARFMSHGSAREIFGWEELMNTQLPVPHIDIQKEIVKEYNVLVNRIALNNQLIKKLEETAQAIYKQWFVDFEFPDEEGKGYKSNGGEMVCNEELSKEIPTKWEYRNFGGVTTIKAGGDKPVIFSDNETDNCQIPVYSNSSVSKGLLGFTNEATIFANSITISARGAIIGYTELRTHPFVPVVRLIVVLPKHEYQLNYFFDCVSKFRYDESGSAQGQLTIPEISSFKIILPEKETLKKYQVTTFKLTKHIETKESEIQKLKELKDLLLSKLATIEN